MRRVLVLLLASAGLTAAIIALPVSTAPVPQARPVPAKTATIALDSAVAPAPTAEVRPGPSTPSAGEPTPPSPPSITRTGLAPFSLVGVTWAGDSAVTDTAVRVRVQNGAGQWGHWTEVGIEDTGRRDDAGRARGGTSPLWTGPSTGVDVQVLTRSGARPTDVRLELVNPGSSPADKTPGRPAIRDQAHAAVTMPPVYSREQWGADPRIMGWDPQYAPTIKAATIHHTADSNNYSADQVPGILRSIYQYHAVSLGWGDIGYNVVVDKFGRLWEGRTGGLASTVIGAHAGGFNTSTFGVSMLGNYDVADAPPVMVDAAASFVAWKFSLYGVNPYGTTTLVSSGGGTAKYAPGVAVTLPTVFGHRDVGNTVCPGQYGYAKLPQIRARAADLLTTSNTPQITDRYNSDAALRALLGAKTGYEQQSAGVVWQPYQGGTLFYSAGTGVKLVRGGILAAYFAGGGPAWLGAPTVEEAALPDGRGVKASFQQADIYWTPTTQGHVVRGAIRNAWQALGGPGGVLGYPTTDERASATNDGAVAYFERGLVLWAPATGAVPVWGAIRGKYEAAGREAGVLGYPAAPETDVPGGRGRVQPFQRGSIYWTDATGARVVFGGIAGRWASLGGPTGVYGFPVSDERDAATRGGRVQSFESGSVYWTEATGAHGVRGAVLSAWAVVGAEGGPAGYPTGEETTLPDGHGRTQTFQSGTVYWSGGTGAHLVRGGVAAAWQAAGGVTGPLAYPTSAEVDGPVAGSRVQRFSGGAVYWSAATGPHTVSGQIGTRYDAAGGAGGILGLPAAEPAPTADRVSTAQKFQAGWICSSGSAAYVVRGGIGGAWQAAGGVPGPLGCAASEETDGPVAGSRVQRFTGGSVYWSPTTGAHTVSGQIATTYDAAGGAGGILGLPTSEAVALPDGVGWRQNFQGGSIYRTSATGARIVRGAIAGAWLWLGGPSGRLGYPTGAEVATTAGTAQTFQGGTVSWTAATGATEVRYQ